MLQLLAPVKKVNEKYKLQTAFLLWGKGSIPITLRVLMLGLLLLRMLGV